MSTLERAVAIAAEAHAGDTDKAGEPYIDHSLRVMLSCETLQERMVAVLHDVVEDSDWTLGRLREEGFSEAVVSGVDALTPWRRTCRTPSPTLYCEVHPMHPSHLRRLQLGHQPAKPSGGSRAVIIALDPFAV